MCIRDSFIGTHIHTLGTSGKLQIFILNNLPSVSPFLSVILFVPINSIFPVSYTHLDVYKRQIVEGAIDGALKMEQTAKQKEDA